MGFIPIEERRRIFRNELYNLKELGYVTSDQYNNVTEAHNEYFSDILNKEQREKEAHEKNHLSQAIAAHPIQTAAHKPNQEPAKPKPVKVKPMKTAEEIRERNISWSLNIGVIMLLIVTP